MLVRLKIHTYFHNTQLVLYLQKLALQNGPKQL